MGLGILNYGFLNVFGKVVLFCIIWGVEDGKFDLNYFGNFCRLVFFLAINVFGIRKFDVNFLYFTNIKYNGRLFSFLEQKVNLNRPRHRYGVNSCRSISLQIVPEKEVVQVN